MGLTNVCGFTAGNYVFVFYFRICVRLKWAFLD